MTMRICSKCSEVKTESEYFVKDSRQNRLHAQCKACYTAQRATNYKEHYEKYRPIYLARAKARRAQLRTIYRTNMLEYLSDKFCVICRENDIRVLEFDHLNPSEKLFSISQAVRLNRSWQDVELEIKKCRILCSNCHKKHTAKQIGWYKNI